MLEMSYNILKCTQIAKVNLFYNIASFLYYMHMVKRRQGIARMLIEYIHYCGYKKKRLLKRQFFAVAILGVSRD